MKLTDVRTMKSGTDYIILKLPKKVLKNLPEGYFYLDIEIKEVRGGKRDV